MTESSFELVGVEGEAPAFEVTTRFLFSCRTIPRFASRAYWRRGRALWATRRQRRLCARTGHPKTALSTLTGWDQTPVTKCLRCLEVV
jgi:hypothetical protein